MYYRARGWVMGHVQTLCIYRAQLCTKFEFLLPRANLVQSSSLSLHVQLHVHFFCSIFAYLLHFFCTFVHKEYTNRTVIKAVYCTFLVRESFLAAPAILLFT